MKYEVFVAVSHFIFFDDLHQEMGISFTFISKHLLKFRDIMKQRYCTFRFMWAQSNKATARQCWDSISEGTQENKLPLAKSSLSSTILKLIKAIQHFWIYHSIFPHSRIAVFSHVTKGPFIGIMNGIWCWSVYTFGPFLVAM